MPLRTRTKTDSSSQISSRFSAWFHGHSVMSSERSLVSLGTPKTWRTQDRFAPIRCASQANRTSRRSPSSTRSIIDPTSSPNVGAEPRQSGSFEPLQVRPVSPIAGTRYGSEEVVGIQGRTKTRTRLALSRPRKKPRHNNEARKCFPDSHVKRKAIETLVFGSILCVALTIYLALTISHKVTSTMFRAVSLVLIVLLAIIFCHDMIRLCMLASAPKGQDYGDALLMQRQTASIARPREPIRIILASDEEVGLHDEHTVVEEDENIAVAPPPPAYGLWRCSVRVDPELIHWQRVEQPAGREEPPALAQSSLTRPPSYHSGHHTESLAPVAHRD